MQAATPIPQPSNPLGLDGIEFIEFATRAPLILGAVVEQLGFKLVARHRSREVMLYRAGSMNLIINASPIASENNHEDEPATQLKAVALRVRNAAYAHQQAIAQGAWDMPSRAAEMELYIPGIRGVGDSLIYFVETMPNFSIYDVDFVAQEEVNPHPPALENMHYFGVVQTALSDRTEQWIDFYQTLLGFKVLEPNQFFGVMHGGVILQSPCQQFYWQIIEPPEGADDIEWQERLHRVGFGAPDVPALSKTLKERGLVFADANNIKPSEQGAVGLLYQSGISVELVHSSLQPWLRQASTFGKRPLLG